MRERLLDAMAKLEPEQGDILLLWSERGYSDAEIAALLGKTRGAVAMMLHRAKERLKELLCDDRELRERKPDAKRKRDSAQPQGTAQPVKDEEGERQ